VTGGVQMGADVETSGYSDLPLIPASTSPTHIQYKESMTQPMARVNAGAVEPWYPRSVRIHTYVHAASTASATN
jgi:hypothetical protein